MKLTGCKSALTPAHPHPTPVVYSINRSKAVVLVLFLLFIALWSPHYFLFFFICVVMLVSLPLGVREGLRLVIVALPGLFSYLFFYYCL